MHFYPQLTKTCFTEIYIIVLHSIFSVWFNVGWNNTTPKTLAYLIKT